MLFMDQSQSRAMTSLKGLLKIQLNVVLGNLLSLTLLGAGGLDYLISRDPFQPQPCCDSETMIKAPFSILFQ